MCSIRYIGMVTSTVLLTACSITQTVNPVTNLDTNQICIIDNPAVRQGFEDAYKRALERKNYTVQILPASASLNDCNVSSTYTANWRWDLAMYMAYAEINVFRGGQKAGDAVYSSMSGGANMGKFIKAETKVYELVDLLFPGSYAERDVSKAPVGKPIPRAK